MNEIPYIGAFLDQTSEQLSKNYKHEEVVATVAPVSWVEKTPDQFLRYKTRDQDGSGTCVVQTYAKELSIIFKQKYGVWIDFSASFPYQHRNNKAIPGCSSTDIYDIFPKIGNVFESFMPSQLMNDEQVMAVKNEPFFEDLAKVWCVKRIELPLDFDTVASTIQQTGKGVMVWFKFNNEEWKDKPVVSDKPTTSGHSITAIDVALYNGEQVIICDESWGLGHSMNGQRLITREYFNARCYQASYLLTFKFETSTEIPSFDGSIESAQRCFKHLGLFPSNIPETGVYGNVTRSACIKFQKLFNIQPQLGNLGPITQKKLIELFP